ncbi:MAG: serine/threonine-protein kinase [Rhodothermales bacterium]
MDPHRWNRLEQLFFAAQERDPAERAAFLDDACADDPELRQELASMLAAEEDGMALALESRLLSDEGDDDRVTDLTGAHIGPYRLEKLIGEGGMGDVYLARRDDDQYDQQVALKLIRPGYRNSELIARFRVERQVLARLNHPNITQLLDGGMDSEGRPYLVMQYVDGVPITEFCDKRMLSIDDRLRLFRTVCAAVQYAHANLVVHRDLKPSNILVTEDGRVKLLDFGIAKLLDPEWDFSVAVTRSHVRLMTPEYAAPEQVRGDAITTATDVYALGVLLYEILTGRRPYRLGKRVQAEIERAICEEAPIRPSTAVTEAAEADRAKPATTPEALSRARRTELSRLKRVLQGDLDNIVMMALRKEPDRRYGSVDQFSQDIRRYLSGRPVAAQKDTAGYRLRKFVRRNRTAVVAVAGVFALILGFGVAMSIQADKLAIERDRARLEAEKAVQVAGFLEDLFTAPDPFATASTRRDTLRIRDFLAQGADKVREELASQPAVQAKLLNVLGAVYKSLGQFDVARQLMEEGLAIRQETPGDNRIDLAESQTSLGLLFKETGDYAPAESLLVEAVALRRALLPPGDPGIAESINALATVLHDKGDFKEAESLYREALALHQAVLDSEDFAVTTDLNNLATLLYQQGNYDEAEPFFRQILDIRRRTLGDMHPDVAGSMSNLAVILQQTGRYDEAEPLYREALAIREQTLGSDHPDVAAGLHNLAAVLKAKGDYDAAEPLYRRSLAMQRAFYGDVHPAVAVGQHNLASLLKEIGQYDEARLLFFESLAVKRKVFGDVHPSVAATLNNLGDLLKEQGDLAGAEPILREALAINRQLLKPDHPRLGITLETLGDLLHRLGNDGEAEPLLVESMTIMRKTLPDDDKRVRKVAGTLVEIYDRAGADAKAEPYRALLAQAGTNG